MSADGGRLVFTSTASLTGYDNADVSEGKAAAEVYIYDAENSTLSCASCNPTGARPHARVVPLRTLWAAATIPTTNTDLHLTPRVLAEDGSRLFFESFDALLPTDTNGAADVYEWERPGTGDCSTESARYFASNGGCLSLISSGQSAEDSEILAVDPDGSNVFIATNESLLPQDPGLIDAYDARVGGGFRLPRRRPRAAKAKLARALPKRPTTPPRPRNPSRGRAT